MAEAAKVVTAPRKAAGKTRQPAPRSSVDGGTSVLDPGSHFPLFGPAPDPDPQMKSLRDAWFDAPDLAAQQTIADRMQLRAFEDPPFVPLGEYFVPAAFRADLSGFVRSYTSLFWNVRRG